MSMSMADYFAYSRHHSLDAAEAALEEYYAHGIVCEGENPLVKTERRGDQTYYCVMFPCN